MPTFSIPNSISPGDPSDATKAMANWNQVVNDLNTQFPNGGTEAALSSWKTFCTLGAEVGSGVSATRFFSPGNVAGTGASWPACLRIIHPSDLSASPRSVQWRFLWNGVVNAVAPAVTFTLGMYLATWVEGLAGSGATVSKGALVAGSSFTWVTPAGNATNAATSSTFTISSDTSYVVAVDPSVATAATSVTDFVVALQYRQA